MGKIIRQKLDDNPVELSEEELRRIDELAEIGGETYYEDIPPMDDEFLDNAKRVPFPIRQQPVSIELTPRAIAYFRERENGQDYRTEISAVVEAYVQQAEAGTK